MSRRRPGSLGPACALGLALLAASPAGAAKAKSGEDKDSVVSQDIVIRGKGRPTPALPPPPTAPEKPVFDEVLHSLDLYKARYKPRGPKVRVAGGTQRLERPFPEPPYLVFSPETFPYPYARWTFEVLADGRPLWRAEGEGRAEQRLSWDGSDANGRFAARAGQAYQFRFTGMRKDGEESSISSEPVELVSLSFREPLGGTRVEVSNAALFAPEKAAFRKEADAYLAELAERMRRVNPGEKPYRVELYQRKPGAKLAKSRAAALRRFLSKALVISPQRVRVELLPWGSRGDVASCLLPREEAPALEPR